MSEDRITVHIDADLEDLIPDFLDNRRGDIQSLTDAIGQQDYETIQRIGHSMKGAGGGYGFDTITDIGRQIEEAATAQNVNEIQDGIDKLSFYLDHIDIIYEEMDF